MDQEEFIFQNMSSGYYICHDLNPVEGVDNIHVLCLLHPKWFGRFNREPAEGEPWFTVLQNFDNATYGQLQESFDDACEYLESAGYITGYNFLCDPDQL